MNYEISVIQCANQRLQVWIHNGDTDEDIKIDENIKDVQMLYYVLQRYFNQAEIIYNLKG